MSIFGYTKYTNEKDLVIQINRLKSAGCTTIIHDPKTNLKNLGLLMSQLNENDTLIVPELDRLARNLPELEQTLTLIKNKNIKFKSLQEKINEITPELQELTKGMNAILTSHYHHT